MQQHWQRYGRNYYTRHDYEAVATDAAQALVEGLRQQASGLCGQRFGDHEIECADDFSYTDPIDGSVSEAQGIRLLLRGGARIVYRLSGTGTEGATLRVYVESPEPDPAQQAKDPQDALAELISLSREVARIDHFTGRVEPDVVT